MMKKINLLLLITLPLIFTACSSKNNEIEQKTVALNPSYKDRIDYLKNKYSEKNEIKKSREEMLKEDADYMSKNLGHAIVENKNYDYPVSRPIYVEPIFAKIEFMPYETKEGIWHEQQSVWVKVKDGQIALKSNPNGTDTVLDQYKSILSK
jgi:hypothetical protein